MESRSQSPRQLPLEILLHIASHVPASSISSLLSTCSSLRQVCEPLLYRSINLSNSPLRSLLLFDAIITRPELGRLVEIFEPADDWAPPGSKSTLKRVFRRLADPTKRKLLDRHRSYRLRLESAAELMPNVRSFTCHGRTDWIIESFKSKPHLNKLRFLEPGQTLAKLTILELSPVLLERVLPLVPNLVSLELAWTSIFDWTHTSLSPEAVPHLEELVCPFQLAPNLVRTRPVKRLTILFGAHRDYTSIIEGMARFGETMDKVHCLHLCMDTLYGWTPTALGGLGPSVTVMFPMVRELGFRINIGKRQGDVALSFAQMLTMQIASLELLETFDLNGCVGFPNILSHTFRSASHPENFRRVIGLWTRQRPTLKKIVFPNGCAWSRDIIKSTSITTLPSTEDEEETADTLEKEAAGWECLNAKTHEQDRLNLKIFCRVPGAIPWSDGPVFTRDLRRTTGLGRDGWPVDLSGKLIYDTIINPTAFDLPDGT